MSTFSKTFLLNKSFKLQTVNSDCDDVESIIKQKVFNFNQKEKDDPFCLVDIGDIVKKYIQWKKELPRIHPHYAVKCNDDTVVLSTLAQLGAGFDCASKNEIKKVKGLGVESSRIIYANPCKQSSHLSFAAKNNVDHMTFDNETELYKIKQLYPSARLIIRILPSDDSSAQCPLGIKFGCSVQSAFRLLGKAKELELDVIGVSFHVGSGCRDASAYLKSISYAREVFDYGSSIGFDMKLLDIGGGFPGHHRAPLSFPDIAVVIRKALDMYFPEEMNVKVISEPGRFFVASAFSVVVNVISKRVISRDRNNSDYPASADDEPAYMYYVNDGLYGSFNSLLYDHAEVFPTLIQKHSSDMKYSSSIWGPTCDGLDCILKEWESPELFVGDWIVFHDMGAYTLASSSTFNAMPRPHVHYIIFDKAKKFLLDDSIPVYKTNLNQLPSGTLVNA